MPTKFEDFMGLYQKMSVYQQAKQKAGDSANIGQNLRQLIMQGTAEYTQDPALMTQYQNSQNTGLFITGFDRLEGYAKEDANDLANAGRVELLASAPDEYLAAALTMIDPKDSYSGPNAAFITKVAGLHKKVKALEEKIRGNDDAGIKEEVNKSYKAQYDVKDKKQKRALELTEALIEVEPAIALARFQMIYQEASEGFNKEIDTNEKKAMYIDGHIEGDDFISYNEGVLQRNNELRQAAQAQAQAQGQQQQHQPRPRPMGGGRRRQRPRPSH